LKEDRGYALEAVLADDEQWERSEPAGQYSRRQRMFYPSFSRARSTAATVLFDSVAINGGRRRCVYCRAIGEKREQTEK
jgi:hypothetical protein